MFKRLGLAILLMGILVSCEKAISFAPRNAGPMVVVEATIENDQPPL
ncbi:hypothetical protein [Paraflavitalea speifideaquila]|nr:hypothetical protein [Paraflavitalea speifideiaquila]